MHYMILMSADPSWDALSDAEQARIVEEHGAFEAALSEAGALISSARFGTTGMAVVQAADGAQHRVPLPAPGAGAIGGYYLIDVDSLEVALDWAARCRFIAGTNWVYPMWE